MGCWIYPFIELPSHPYFVPPIQVSYLGGDYYIRNRLEALNTMLLPLAKMGGIQIDLDHFIFIII